jgi:predicted ATP-dependent serine protease
MWTCESCGTENQEDDEHCQTCDTWRSEQEDDEPGPVLCECGASADLLHDCDAADRATEK